MREYAQFVSNSSITVHFVNGDSHVWPSSHPNFESVKEALKRNAPASEVRALMDTVARLKESIAPLAAATAGDVKVTREGVFYKGTQVRLSVTEKILRFVAEGFDATPYVNFLEKLFKNPRKSAVESLYDFLEANQIAITEDGDFIVFKKVRNDYKDIHSGTFDNSVGTSPRVEAWQVEEDRSKTCSQGLHVCARHYLPHFGSGFGNRVVICKVNPADVVAVPYDYNNAKMRVCAYEVIGELNDQQKAEIFDDKLLVRPGDNSEDVSWGGSWAEDEAVKQDEGQTIDDAVNSELEGYEDDNYEDDNYEDDDYEGDYPEDESSELSEDEQDTIVTEAEDVPPPAEEPAPAPEKKSWWGFGKKW